VVHPDADRVLVALTHVAFNDEADRRGRDDKGNCFIPIIDSLLGSPKMDTRAIRSNRLLGAICKSAHLLHADGKTPRAVNRKSALNDHAMPTIVQNAMGCSSLRTGDHSPAVPTNTHRIPHRAKTDATYNPLAWQAKRSGM
jgi:hypothetical protein